MLYKSEFAKHHSLFSVLLALLLLLLNIGITAWQYRGSFTDEGRQIAAAQAELIALYNTDREEYYLRLADFNDRMSAYEVDMQISLVRNGTMPVFENKLIDFPTYGDSQLFRDVKNVVNAPQEYPLRNTTNTFHAIIMRISVSARARDCVNGGIMSLKLQNLTKISSSSTKRE